MQEFPTPAEDARSRAKMTKGVACETCGKRVPCRWWNGGFICNPCRYGPYNRAR